MKILSFCPTIHKIQIVTRFASSSNLVAEPKLRALNVAVIGCPNVGKSALTNTLVKADVCPVSKRIDTTRVNSTVSLTEESIQLSVVDSPGLIGIQHARKAIGTHSDDRILSDPEKALERAEFVIVVQDATANGAYLHHRVLHLLYRYSHIPSCLVLNKIDMVQRRTDLLKLTEVLTEGLVNGVKPQTKAIRMGILSSIVDQAKTSNKSNEKLSTTFPLHRRQTLKDLPKDEEWLSLYHKLLQKPAHKCSWYETRKIFGGQAGWPHFEAVFFVSALTGEGTDALRSHLQIRSKPTEKWRLDPNSATKRIPRYLCADHIRSELLDHCPADVAYNLKPKIIEWNEEKNGERISRLEVVAEVDCDIDRWAKIVMKRVNSIEEKMTTRLKTMLAIHPSDDVQFQLHVKHKGKLFDTEHDNRCLKLKHSGNK